PLEPRGRPLEIAVVDRQHHRPAAFGIQDAREAVLHPPVERAGPLDVEGTVLRRDVEMELLGFLAVIGLGHAAIPRWAVAREGAWRGSFLPRAGGAVQARAARRRAGAAVGL